METSHLKKGVTSTARTLFMPDVFIQSTCTTVSQPLLQTLRESLKCFPFKVTNCSNVLCQDEHSIACKMQWHLLITTFQQWHIRSMKCTCFVSVSELFKDHETDIRNRIYFYSILHIFIHVIYIYIECPKGTCCYDIVLTLFSVIDRAAVLHGGIRSISIKREVQNLYNKILACCCVFLM